MRVSRLRRGQRHVVAGMGGVIVPRVAGCSVVVMLRRAVVGGGRGRRARGVRLVTGVADVLRHGLSGTVESALGDPGAELLDRCQLGVVGDIRGLRDRVHLDGGHSGLSPQGLLGEL